MMVEVWSIDLSVDTALDLSKEEVMKSILVAVTSGFFHAIVAGPPCATWSKARYNRLCSGPRPLRSRREPWGRTDITMSAAERRQVTLASTLLTNTLRIMAAISKIGGKFILEHPRDPGHDPYPSIWELPEVRELQKASQGQLLLLDQCRYGQKAKKPTTLLTNATAKIEDLSMRCCHQEHPVTLQGKDEAGAFRTSAAQTYASELCKPIAEVLLEEFRLMMLHAAGPDPKGHIESESEGKFPPPARGRAPIRRRMGERIPAPPLSSTWLPVARWATTYRGLWRHAVHITIQELRTVVGLLRHLARSRRNWGHKVLLLIDSMAALGVIAKGRSSSLPLLRLARQVCAISLAFDIRPAPRYIPSEVNPSDGPSRGLPVGAALQTQQAHADRLRSRLSLHHGALQTAGDDSDAAAAALLLAKARACAGFAGG